MGSKEPRIKIEYGTEVTIATFVDASILEDVQIKDLEKVLLPAVERNEDKRLVLNFENVRFMSSAFWSRSTST